MQMGLKTQERKDIHAGLTKKQQKCLDIIKAAIEFSGIAPTLEEIRVEMGVPSRSEIFRLLELLADRGHIIRRHNMARSITLPPPEHCPHCGGKL